MNSKLKSETPVEQPRLVRPLLGWPKGKHPSDATKSASEYVLDHFKGRKCDSEAVADCLKCNATFLARESLNMIRTLAEIDETNVQAMASAAEQPTD
jgi:hypothetical protein